MPGALKKAPEGAKGCLQTKGALRGDSRTKARAGNQPARLPGLENFQRVLDNQADFIQIRLVIGRASGHLANTERHILQ